MFPCKNWHYVGFSHHTSAFSRFSLARFRMEGKLYFDCCLPMGCLSSCNIFETFSTALKWIASTKLRASAAIHILEDFLFLALSQDKCHRDLDNLIQLCNNVGVPIADEKTVGPATCLQFAGITLDTVNIHACLPEDKLECSPGLLTEIDRKWSVTLKELQSLIWYWILPARLSFPVVLFSAE